MSEPEKNIAVNRKAQHEYFLLEKWEAGLVLLGSEVKSLRAGRASLQEAYVRLDDKGNAWLIGCHIPHYAQAGRNNHEPMRHRQLLLHNSELKKLRKGTREKGMTIVPLRIYIKGSLIKLEIALGKGKKLFDKRESNKAASAKRDMDRGR